MDIEELPGGRSLPKRQQSSAFGGLLGNSIGRKKSLQEAGDLLAAAKLATIPNVSLTLIYDEDDFPGVDLDFQIFAFDKSGGYLDCLCNRNRTMPGMELSKTTISISWCDLPTNCSVFVLSIVSYTSGMSISDLEGAHVVVATADTALPSREIYRFKVGSHDAPGPALFFAILAEMDDNWIMQSSREASTEQTADFLMKTAKELAENFVHGMMTDNLGEVVYIKPPVALDDEHQDEGGWDESGSESDRGAKWHHRSQEGDDRQSQDERTKKEDKTASRCVASVQEEPQESSKAIMYAQRYGVSVVAKAGGISELREKLQQRRTLQSPPGGKTRQMDFAGVSDAELKAKLIERRKATGSMEAEGLKVEPEPRSIEDRIKGNKVKERSKTYGAPTVGSDATQFTRIMQNLTTVELSVSSLELGIEQIRTSLQSLRDGVEKLESNQTRIAEETKNASDTITEGIDKVESRTKATEEKIDTLLVCFKEAGYI